MLEAAIQASDGMYLVLGIYTTPSTSSPHMSLI